MNFIFFFVFVPISIVLSLSIKESDKDVSIVAILETADAKFMEEMRKSFDKKGQENGLNYILNFVLLEEGQEYPCFMNVCKVFKDGVSLVLDFSWRGFNQVADLCFRVGAPYQRIDTTIGQFVHAADDYLENRNITDAVLIFQSEKELHQGLHYLIGNSIIRVLVLSTLTVDIAKNLTKLKPVPSNYVAFGSGSILHQIIDTAQGNKLVTKDSKWHLVYEDFNEKKPQLSVEKATITYFQPKNELCCQFQGKAEGKCSCDTLINEEFTIRSFDLIATMFDSIKKDDSKILSVVHDCSDTTTEDPPSLKANRTYKAALKSELADFKYIYNDEKMDNILRAKLNLDINTGGKEAKPMGIWTSESLFTLDPTEVGKVILRHFKVGIASSMPFTYNTEEKPDEYLGFCIKLLEKMATDMNFTYDLIPPTDGTGSYGKRFPDGGWDGLIGDLVNGTTDMIVAALTMTSEREEAIDFVAPHFEQTGISIVMKKAEKEVSLFKFMSVLDPEVWWCILGAIILTAFVLWILDKYSPFSGQNKKKYPYECRKFSLVECFWFALTSITPQGGGEPPKAISARILVAAYWLFVVLMLATFTANLAAFLTVERMQTPVSSLEELARQSKINYTVVRGSVIEQYFKNMANAEEELYKAWKDLTLNSTVDQEKYRVWDYPVKEQYGRIYKVIQDSGMVNTTEEGFLKVKNDKDGSFAFIHDTAEVKYEVYKSCDLLEVGEPFAEQPYAIAVQAGSPLQEEISKELLDLQKDRYFEVLVGEFWNTSKKRECPNYEETEGINLQSLGGVFIATLVGLTIGMLTLVGEVVLAKNKEKNKVQAFISEKQRSAKVIEGIRTRVIHPRPRLAYRY